MFCVYDNNISAPPRSTPAPDYEVIPGLGYYKLHKDAQTWHTARVICQKEGAYLAIINSDFELSVMKMLFDQNPALTDDWRNPFAFVGISDLKQPKNFVTIFGKFTLLLGL